MDRVRFILAALLRRKIVHVLKDIEWPYHVYNFETQELIRRFKTYEEARDYQIGEGAAAEADRNRAA